MTASSPDTLLTGDIGIAGVKLLTSLMPPLPPFRGGAEFDHPVSGNQLQQVGCLDPTDTNCQPTTVEAAYNILTVFFNKTPADGFYNGTVGTNYIQYLEVPYVDVEYAETKWCPDTNSLTLGSMSLQDLLNRASHDLFAMAGLELPLPPPTCHSVGPLASSGTQSQFSFTTNSDGASWACWVLTTEQLSIFAPQIHPTSNTRETIQLTPKLLASTFARSALTFIFPWPN